MGKFRSKIKPIVVDRLGDGGAHQEINRQTGLDAFADLGRRNAEGKTRQRAAAKRRGEWRGHPARPWNDDEFDED